MNASRWVPSIGFSLMLIVSIPTAVSAQEPKAKPADSAVQVKPETAKGEAASPAPPTPAPNAAPAQKGEIGIGKGSILNLFTRVNPMLWVLGLCSVVTIGYAMERLVALRRSRVIPREFIERFMERLASGKLDRDRAIELCRANDSVAARVFAHVVRYWGQPASTIRQAVEHDAAGEVLDLKRNVRVLNGAATLAPLLGLLGTVFGMIESFDSLKTAAGGKSEALAHGISLALVSTAIGLSIAAVAVTMYYYLLNRVDILVKQLDDQARRVIDLVANESGRPAVERRAPHDSRIH